MRATEKDWNDVRTAFATSIMVDTALSSLAQNLDGPAWPIKGKDETPAKYIDLSFAEANELLALKGQPPERIDDLIAILRDTLAFDQPFGEMVEQVETATKQDQQLQKNLARIEVPENLPTTFLALTAETRDFCKRENLGTIGEFALFSQNLAQNVIVGGEFRTLLNALAHLDEKTLSQFIPLRTGATGLHIPEALALALKAYSRSIQAALAQKAGAKLAAADQTLAGQADKQQVEAAEAALRLHLADIVSSPCFRAALMALQSQFQSGASLDRLVMPIANPSAEAIVARLLAQHFKNTRASAPSAESSPSKKGFFSRLFGRG